MNFTAYIKLVYSISISISEKKFRQKNNEKKKNSGGKEFNNYFKKYKFHDFFAVVIYPLPPEFFFRCFFWI